MIILNSFQMASATIIIGIVWIIFFCILCFFFLQLVSIGDFHYLLFILICSLLLNMTICYNSFVWWKWKKFRINIAFNSSKVHYFKGIEMNGKPFIFICSVKCRMSRYHWIASRWCQSSERQRMLLQCIHVQNSS